MTTSALKNSTSRDRHDGVGAVLDVGIREDFDILSLKQAPVAHCFRGGAFTPTPASTGIVVENHGDIPFSKPEDIGPETAAHMVAVAADRVWRETALPLGVNVLANAALHALAVASAARARFVRVNQWGKRLCRQRRCLASARARA
jgi:hypothetical protein